MTGIRTNPLPALPDQYRCNVVLGEGATGVVYHAFDRILNHEVAVKVVKTNLALHRRFRARFAREVAISARISHPHVVPVYDTGSLSSGEPFVVLGYASGGSLSDLLKQRPPIQQVLRLIDEVLDALAAMHARLLLHQDLKPGNVLLHPGEDGELHAWVGDLGVADALAELNRDRKVISGTPGYMSPEQLQGRTQDLGPWTDLYAIGLIIHEMLSGNKPHAGEGRHELLEARLLPPPRLRTGPRSDVPNALAEVVASLLDPEPRQRFDRASDVRRALRDAIKGVSFRGRVKMWRTENHSSTHSRLTQDFPLSVPAPLGPVPHGTLRWNRVPPDPLPAQPPHEHGAGAPGRTSLPLFALREVPMVGRDRERKVVWDAAREVIALQEPRVVLIIGESGTGKTRLVDSIAHSLEDQGYMEVIHLRYHSPPGVDDGYRGAVRDLLVPWNDTREGCETRLARWLGRDRQVLPKDVHEEAEVLARWCGYLKDGETPVSDAVGLAYLYRHLDVRAWRGGSCLVLEDAHSAQADGDGLAIAEALLDRTVGERPTLVLCTLSAEVLARDAAIRRKVDALASRGARRINLRRLTLAETRRVVQESLALDPDLAQSVSLECEGDPLSAGLLLREWASRKLLVFNARSEYTLPPTISAEAAFPSDHDELVRRRLRAALDHSADPVGAEETIAAIALAGQEPPVALIRIFNDAGLDAILATGLVAERRGYLVFEHVRIWQKALEFAATIPDPLAIHRRLADAWEQLGESTGLDVYLPLGLHRLRASEPARAVGPLLAATKAMNQGGRRDAIRAAALAIEAADIMGQPTARIEARRLHAEALLESGEPERAMPLIQHALREVEGDRLARTRLHVLLGRAARKQGDLELAHRELEQARGVFAALRDRNGLVEVAVQRARLARAEGRADNAIAFWSEVLRMNRGDLVLESEALNGLVEARVRAGQLDGIDKLLERLLSVSRASGDTRRIAEGYATRGLLHMERKQWEEAEHFLSSAGAIAATLGADALHLRCRSLLADVLRYSGRLEAAEEVVRWVARFAGERGHVALVANARIQLALLALTRNEPKRVREEVDLAADALAASPRHALWLQIGLLRAVTAAERGDERTCRAWFAVATERGLLEVQSPDLWLPLERLVASSERAGWLDITRRAAARVYNATRATVEVLDEDGFNEDSEERPAPEPPPPVFEISTVSRASRPGARGPGSVIPINRPRPKLPPLGATFGSPLPPPRSQPRPPPPVAVAAELPAPPPVSPATPPDGRVRVKTVSRKAVHLGDEGDTPQYPVSMAAPTDTLAVVDEDGSELRGVAIGRMLAHTQDPSTPLTPLSSVDDEPPEDEVTDKVER